MIRPVEITDAAVICEIYNYYIDNTTVTFEETGVSEDEMSKRISTITQKYPWLVYELDGSPVAYAYATEWKPRNSYRYTAEATIYLKNGMGGHGIGSELYKALLTELSVLGVHAVLGGIALPNEGSVALHEKFGFEKVAHFRQTGYKFDHWIDVAYWEKILED